MFLNINLTLNLPFLLIFCGSENLLIHISPGWDAINASGSKNKKTMLLLKSKESCFIKDENVHRYAVREKKVFPTVSIMP